MHSYRLNQPLDLLPSSPCLQWDLTKLLGKTGHRQIESNLDNNEGREQASTFENPQQSKHNKVQRAWRFIQKRIPPALFSLKPQIHNWIITREIKGNPKTRRIRQLTLPIGNYLKISLLLHTIQATAETWSTIA